MRHMRHMRLCIVALCLLLTVTVLTATILTVVFLNFFLITDSPLALPLVFFSSEEEIANRKFEQIVEGVNEKDPEKIKGVFSEQALTECDNIDEGIEYLYDLFDGGITSWDLDHWSSGDSMHYGTVVSSIRSWYNVETDRGSFLVFMLDYSRNDPEPDKKGLYAFRAIKEENRPTQFTYWQDMEIPGIYIPDPLPQP